MARASAAELSQSEWESCASRAVGHVAGDRVERLPRRLLAVGPLALAPAAAAQPGAGARPRQGAAHAVERLLERLRSLEADLALRERPGRKVDVRVGEAGEDAPPAEVDDVRRGERSLVRADAAGDPIARDRESETRPAGSAPSSGRCRSRGSRCETVDVRALASLLAVAAVVAVAAAAAVDSFRGAPAAIPGDVRGELVYSDASCHRHAVGLPGLARRDFLTVGCGVFTRHDNLGVRNGAVAWFAYPVPGGTTTLLRPRELPPGVTVQTVAWLGGRRFAAVPRAERRAHRLAGQPAAEGDRERNLHGAARKPVRQVLRGARRRPCRRRRPVRPGALEHARPGDRVVAGRALHGRRPARRARDRPRPRRGPRRSSRPPRHGRRLAYAEP